jgi:hypothetical protein
MLAQLEDVNSLSLKQTAEIVEASEAGYFRSTFEGISAETKAAFGTAAYKIGGATVAVIEKMPVTAFNRVIGLGDHQPATEAMIDEIIALYGRTNTPFGISVSPAAQPTQLTDWLLERGFKFSYNLAKVIRGTEPPPVIKTDLRIEPVTEANAADFGYAAQQGFGMPEWITPLMAEAAIAPNIYGYVAYAGDEPAAVGALAVTGEVGHLFNGATVPKFRRRGAQGAIMARRIEKGIELGLRWLATETGESTPEMPNSSYNNMIRTGFKLAYLRPFFEYTG